MRFLVTIPRTELPGNGDDLEEGSTATIGTVEARIMEITEFYVIVKVPDGALDAFFDEEAE